jgi:hypothetical protein
MVTMIELCNGIDDDCDGEIDENLILECGNNEGVSLDYYWYPWVCSSPECVDIDNDSYSVSGGECGEIDCNDNDLNIHPSAEEMCDNIDNDCDLDIDENIVRDCGCDCSSAKVLMVLDDFHHNEDLDDFYNIYDNLVALGVDVTKIDEPIDGLTWNQVKDYELLWFTNPGHPMDDIGSLDVIKQFYESGRPVVMQGDDLTRARGFDTKELEDFIGLKYLNNGKDKDYLVMFNNAIHPLLKHLAGRSIIYKNDDIDSTAVVSDEIEILARAELINQSSYNGSAIIVKDGTDKDKGILVLTLLTFNKIEPVEDALTFTANIINWLLTETKHCECGPNNGVCQKGKQECAAGQWSICNGADDPEIELCNGIDDDCDGEIDENLILECGNNEGVCDIGLKNCVNGAWGECSGLTGSNEVCDGLDNDCDGEIDENLTLVCGTDVGECSFGIKECINGAYGECFGDDSSEEICDSLDNDCDGTVDEDCDCVNGEIRQCGIGVGECLFSEQICIDGLWSECNSTQPVLELCDGFDNDCDGEIDENLTQQCGTDVGVCEFGESICVLGNWSECNLANLVDEQCNDNLDNDCDGYVDEGCGGGSSGGGGSKKKNKNIANEPKNDTKSGHFFMPKSSFRSSSDKKCLSKEPVIVDVEYPAKVDITDSKFNIIVKVLNPGECVLENIPLDIELEEGWGAKSLVIETLGGNEEAVVVFDAYSELCNYFEGEKELNDEEIYVKVSIPNEENKFSIPLEIPKVSTIINKDSIKNNKLDICFIVNEKNSEDLEIEFELSDRVDDLIIDYISPVVLSDKPVIKKIEYDIKITRKKEYKIRSYLFKGGKIFRNNYLVADYEKSVDLSEAELSRDWFSIVISKFKGVFN